MRRPRRFGGWAVVALVLGPAVALDGAPQSSPSLAAVLASAAGYIADYERQISAIVSEERYLQRIQKYPPAAVGLRELRSDVLVINEATLGWISFRDVYEVDGRPVRDREERLSRLFLQPTADSYLHLKQITDESARFNLNIPGREVTRTINLPMSALVFIRAQNQHRSRFRIEGHKTHDGAPHVIVGFEERESPRIIATMDNAAARGLFWVEPDSGRIVRSELMVDTYAGGLSPLNVTITVMYGSQPKLGLWVPVSMDERYRMGQTATIVGQATYANFRKFTVDTSTVIKAP